MKVHICGVAFDDLGAEDAVRAAMRESDEPCWVATPNAVMLESCMQHPEQRELLNSSSMVLADGAGVVMAAKRQGTPLGGRTAGIDFGDRLMAAAAVRGDRVFLLGGGDGIAEGAAEHLRAVHPGLCVCGCYWGYFEKDGDENRRVLGMIRACRPDILLVCLGFPVQETWMRENLPFLPSVRIAAGLGGSLDVWAGKRSRAPQFMQTHGMEWAWRMAQSPSKLRQLPALFRFTRQIRRTHEIVD